MTDNASPQPLGGRLDHPIYQRLLQLLGRVS